MSCVRLGIGEACLPLLVVLNLELAGVEVAPPSRSPVVAAAALFALGALEIRAVTPGDGDTDLAALGVELHVGDFPGGGEAENA